MKSSRMILLVLLIAVLALALPVLAQDATPESTAQIAKRTFVAENGVASVDVPPDWILTNNSNSDSVISIKLSNSQSAMDKELFNQDDVFASGEVHIEFELIELAEMLKSFPDKTLTTNSTPMEIIEALSKQGMPDEFTFGKPGAITVNDNPAVRMNLTAGKRGEGQLMLAIYNKKWLAGLILYAAPGEGDKWDLIARDILASVKFDVNPDATAEPTPDFSDKVTIESTLEPVALTLMAKTSNGLASLSYPEGWFSRQSSDNVLYLSNLESGIEKSFGSAMEKGEVNIYVSFSATADFIKAANLPLKDDASTLEILQGTMKAVGDSIKFGTAEQTSVGDKLAARVDFSSTDFEGTAWLIEYQKGAMVAVQMLAAPGESAQWQATTLAIAQSARSTD
jgi:hypothetical protein